MAITRLTAANAITGTLPAANINDTSIGNITALPAGVGGKVLQVVSATQSTENTQSSPTNNTFYFPSTNKLSASITPSSTSSHIIIIYVSTLRIDLDSAGGTDYGGSLGLRESISGGSTTDIVPKVGASYAGGFYQTDGNTNDNTRVRLSEIVYRSPSTTNSITYEVGMSGYRSNLIRMNDNNSTSKIVLYEVAG